MGSIIVSKSFVSSVIGQRDYFGFGSTTLKWKAEHAQKQKGVV